MEKTVKEKTWYVYILRCRDDTLYTGITDDVPRRLDVHNSGKGAKYTRGRGPVTLCYQEQQESYSAALKREYAIKQLPRQDKLALIRSQSGQIHHDAPMMQP